MTVDFTYLFYGSFYHDVQSSIDWIKTFWTSCFVFIAIYLLLIYYGKRHMQNRPPYKLRFFLFLWNLCLATFSVIGAYKFIVHLNRIWITHGFQGTVCLNPLMSVGQDNIDDLGYWTWLFGVSKLVELGDTAFIVLRKRKLLFVHWYHHVTVLVYSWYSLSDLVSTGNWFLTVNFAVHAAMYSYYTLNTVKLYIPKVVPMVITIGEISQMVVGLYVNWWAFGALSRQEKCDVGYRNIVSSLVIYASYWILFVHLFYATYVKKEKMELRKKCD